MPLFDPNIIGGLQPVQPLRDPVRRMGEMMELREYENVIKKRKEEEVKKQRVEDIFKRHTGLNGPRYQDILSNLYRDGLIDEAMAMEEKMQEQSKLQLDRMTKELELEKANWQIADGVLASIHDQETYEAARARINESLPEGMTPLGPEYDEERIAQLRQGVRIAAGMTRDRIAGVDALSVSDRESLQQNTAWLLSNTTSAAEWKIVLENAQMQGLRGAMAEYFGSFSEAGKLRAKQIYEGKTTRSGSSATMQGNSRWANYHRIYEAEAIADNDGRPLDATQQRAVAERAREQVLKEMNEERDVSLRGRGGAGSEDSGLTANRRSTIEQNYTDRREALELQEANNQITPQEFAEGIQRIEAARKRELLQEPEEFERGDKPFVPSDPVPIYQTPPERTGRPSRGPEERAQRPRVPPRTSDIELAPEEVIDALEDQPPGEYRFQDPQGRDVIYVKEESGRVRRKRDETP